MLEEELKQIIIEKYGSVRQFSFKINIPYTTVDSILKRGIDNSNVGNVIKMCKALNISIDNLIDKKEIIPDLNFDNAEISNINSERCKIPILGVIKAGIPIEAQENIIGYTDIPKEWTRGNKKFFGLKISGNSMIPNYQDGDLVIFESTTEFNNGDDCVVMINSSDCTFKKVAKTDEGLLLQPYNIAEFELKFFSKEDVMNLPICIVGVAKEYRRKI